MNCQNCGTFNNAGSKFCIMCGQPLDNSQAQGIQPQVQNINVNNTQSQNENSFQPNVIPTQNYNVPSQNENNFQSNAMPTQNYSVPSQNENNFGPSVAPAQNYDTSSQNNDDNLTKVSFMEYFFIILAVILKPFTAFKEELGKFNAFKNSAIASLIVAGIATLTKLVTSILSVVREKEFDWTDGYKTTWNWDNLGEIDYVQVVGKNFLIYLGIIVAIAAVYYIASLIIKKQTNFSRLLGISALAVVPMIICSLILSPLLSLIWVKLALPITIVGAVYTMLLLYEGMNSEVLLDGDIKYYFNLICLSILGIAAYYLYLKLFMGSMGGYEDIMDLFS